jgi:hypothetical protein
MQLIAEDVAEAEFLRMCEAYRVDTDESKMNEDELNDLRAIKAKLVHELCSGALSLSEDGHVTYMPQHSPSAKPMKFGDVTGATFIAMDGAGMGKPNERMCRGCDQITGSSPGTTSKLRISDFRICMALTNLFLAAG